MPSSISYQHPSHPYYQELLNECLELKPLFKGAKELLSIQKLFNSPSLKKIDGLWFNRWQIALIFIRFPFDVLLYLFYKGVSQLLSLFSFPNRGRIWNLYAEHCCNQFEIALTQLTWGRKFLVPSQNILKLKFSSLFNLEKTEKIEKGVCYGGVNWFNYLFLKSIQNKEFESDQIKRLAIAVAHLFQDGQPKQAAMMQCFYGYAHLLLDFKENEVSLNSSLIKTINETTSLNTTTLADGVYLLAVKRHGLSYIKYKGLELIWDPGQGLFDIESKEDVLSLFSYYDTDLNYPHLKFILQEFNRKI